MFAILGGSFNPVHKGHIELAQKALELPDVGRVVLMPCYQHQHGKALLPPEMRIQMCLKAVKGMESITVSDFEITHKMDGKCINTVKAFETEYPSVPYSLIIGKDNADNIHKWFHYEELIKKVPFIVFPREYEILKEVFRRKSLLERITECTVQVHEGEMVIPWYQKPPHRFVPERVRQCSSSEIREILRTWWQTRRSEQYLNDVLHEDVFDYIKERLLFKNDDVTAVGEPCPTRYSLLRKKMAC